MTTRDPGTSISSEAAELALVCVRSEDSPLGRVLVETERVVASDRKRLIIITEPDGDDGMFAMGEPVALVTPEALKDAVRGDSARVRVPRKGQLASLDEKGKPIRFVPFEPMDIEGYPDWSSMIPRGRDLSVKVNAKLLGEILMKLASCHCVGVELRVGMQHEPLQINAELPNKSRVVAVVMPMQGTNEVTIPGMPMPVEEQQEPEDIEGQGKLPLEAGDDDIGEVTVTRKPARKRTRDGKKAAAADND